MQFLIVEMDENGNPKLNQRAGFGMVTLKPVQVKDSWYEFETDITMFSTKISKVYLTVDYDDGSITTTSSHPAGISYSTKLVTSNIYVKKGTYSPFIDSLTIDGLNGGKYTIWGQLSNKKVVIDKIYNG